MEGPQENCVTVKRSADCSKRRKSESFHTAMSMLVFYRNRTGTRLNEEQENIPQQAKEELRKLYDRS